MAGDWLKVRIDIHSDPAVIAVAARLGVSENEVVGGLIRLWGWANSQTIDGHAPGVTPEWIDRHAGVTLASRSRHAGVTQESRSRHAEGSHEGDTHALGFARALAEQGWLTISETGITIPNFDRHNGDPAKKRAQSAQRSSAYRDRGHAGVTPESRSRHAVSVTEASPEKRRKKDTPLPPKGGERGLTEGGEQDAAFSRVWDAYPEGKRASPVAARMAWDELAPTPETAARILAAVLHHAASGEWTRRAPGVAKYLRQGYWKDGPPAEEAPAPRPAPAPTPEEQREAAELMRRRRGQAPAD